MDPKVIEKLKIKGLKCTPQRLDIINGIIRVPGHCTVETIYEQAKSKDPGISASTVYRTLETLVEIGELKIVNVSRYKNYYDTKLDSHHHIVCIKCGKIEDVKVKIEKMVDLGDGDYGIRWMTIIKDDQGNTYNYFGYPKLGGVGSAEDIYKGSWVMRAKVKKHYVNKNGIKVTVIGYPKFGAQK